jgi:hypothetical protein
MKLHIYCVNLLNIHYVFLVVTAIAQYSDVIMLRTATKQRASDGHISLSRA